MAVNEGGSRYRRCTDRKLGRGARRGDGSSGRVDKL